MKIKFTNPFATLAAILRTVRRIEAKEEIVMATLAEVQAVLDGIPPVLQNIVADEAKQAEEIQSLKDIIAAGGTITEAQLDPLLERANAIKAAVNAMDLSVA